MKMRLYLVQTVHVRLHVNAHVLLIHHAERPLQPRPAPTLLPNHGTPWIRSHPLDIISESPGPLTALGGQFLGRAGGGWLGVLGEVTVDLPLMHLSQKVSILVKVLVGNVMLDGAWLRASSAVRLLCIRRLAVAGLCFRLSLPAADLPLCSHLFPVYVGALALLAAVARADALCYHCAVIP